MHAASKKISVNRRIVNVGVTWSNSMKGSFLCTPAVSITNVSTRQAGGYIIMTIINLKLTPIFHDDDTYQRLPAAF